MMKSCFPLKRSKKLKSIRVVHLNGQVEDYDYPVSVSEVIGNNSNKHFVFTPAQFLSNGSKPLTESIMLERGQIYFLLPHSTYHSSVSPVDLAPIAKKLNAIAKNTRCGGVKQQQRALELSLSSQRAAEIGLQEKYALQRSVRLQSWKPILETIRERSFNRRSESDLQEKN